jgi:hypothetical protein
MGACMRIDKHLGAGFSYSGVSQPAYHKDREGIILSGTDAVSFTMVSLCRERGNRIC